MDDPTDRDVIRLVLTGDRDAYRVLVDRHYQYAFRLAFRVVGDAADAEEVTQEAFFRAYTRLSSFRQDATFSTWVNRIVINTALNLVERDLQHAGEPLAGDGGSLAVQVADRTAGPERLLLDREAHTLREAAMDTLTPMERTAFTLRHMEEMPIPEIAEALRVPANSAKQAVFRAVGKLRRALAPAAGAAAGGMR